MTVLGGGAFSYERGTPAVFQGFVSVSRVIEAMGDLLLVPYRGTSLIRKRPPLGSYSEPMPRSLRWSLGSGRFLMSEVPLETA